MSVLQAGLLNQSSAQVIDGSLKFDNTESNHLSRTPGASGNKRIWTWSSWIKRTKFGANGRILRINPSGESGIQFASDDKLELYHYANSSYTFQLKTTQVLRDTGWYHIVIAFDTTQSTSTDRVKFYINGTQVTSFSTSSYPSEDFESYFNLSSAHSIFGSDLFPAGYVSQVNWIDGAALGPENFGFTDQLTNTWRPKKYTGTFAIASGTPSVANGGLVIKADGASINGTFGVGGSVKTWTSPDGVTWTRDGSGRTSAAAKYLAVGGAGTALRTFYPDAGSGGFSFYMYNDGGEFDGTSTPFTLDLSSQTYLPSQTSSFGDNGFYLPMDGNSPIGQDKSGNGNDWTPVNFGGSAGVDKATGALPILEGAGGAVANVGVRTDAYAQGDPNNQLSRNYSSNTTATGGFSGSYPKTNLFDGAAPADGNRAEAASNDDPINITFDPPITVSSTISLWSGKSSTRYQINDSGTYTTYSDAVGSYKDISHSGSLSNIKILHGSAGQAAGISAIKIDGTQLIDSGLTLALPLVGSANDVSNRINSGSTAKTVSVNGDPASSTLQSNFYGASFYFDGSTNTDYVSVADNDQLDVGSGDFTIECWAYVSGYPNNNPGLLSKRGGNGAAHWQLVLNRNGQIQFGDQATWSNYFGTSSGTTGDTIFKDNWHHIAITRTSGSVQAWYDGRKYGTAITNTTDFSTSANFSVGVGRENNYDPFQGYVNDVRVYKGVAKYTENFIPASTNPDILPDTPSGVSGSSKLAKITEGAVSFDGSGDSLSITGSSDVQFRTGVFTAECFVYSSGYPGSGVYGIFDTGSSVNANRFSMVLYPSGLISIDSNVNLLQSSSAISANAWNHIAFVREGTGSNQAKLYINGVLSNQATISTDFTNDDLLIGKTIDNLGWKGFISNVRIIKGTALYTSNFTPPSAPLTNVTYTKLLCCQSNTFAGAAVTSPNMGGINDGTVWSSGGYGDSNWDSSFPIQRGFNGEAAYGSGNFNMARPNNANVTATWNAPKPIPFTTLKLTAARDSGSYSNAIKINDIDVTSQFTANTSTLATVTITGVTSPLTKLELTAQSGVAQPRFTAIYIDDVILKDPLTPNGDAAATNFNPFNTDINTVRGQETGYATWNPLTNRGVVTTSDGNLTANAINSGYGYTLSTIPLSSGKYYCEISFEGTMAHSVNYNYIGIVPTDSAAIYTGQDIFRADGALSIDSNGSVIRGNIGTGSNDTNNTYQSSYGFDENDTIGIAIDCDTPQVTFYKNGTSIGTFPHTMQSNKSWVLFVNDWANAADFTGYILNAGQKPFKFSPPDGFQSINAANVRPETVISRPDQYVGVTTYVGNGDPNSNTQTVRGLNFGDKPDFVWIKQRSSTAQNHALFDSIRGPGHNLSSSTNHAERSDHSGATGDLMSFDVNGFTVGSSAASGARPVNLNGKDIVAWCWKAGGNKNTFNVDDVGYANASDVGMSVGSLNSASYNTSNRWSDDYSGATIDSSYPITQAFDGNRSTASRVSATQTAMSVDLTNITVTDRIEICGEIGYITPYVSVTVGGVTHQIGGDPNTLISGSAGTTSRVITGVSGALTNVTVGRVSSGRTFLSQIIVDGKILVDDNITPPNLPSIANIGASVGTKQGFSIIQYQGGGNNVTTVSHGLLQSPQFMIIKNIDDADDWTCYHEGAGNSNYLTLNSNAAATDGTMFNDTTPTSTVFTLGAAPGSDYHNRANRSGYDYIAYLWHDIPGLQKFGTYEGNGNVDGPYVELGFTPAILMLKNYDDTEHWYVYDPERSPHNVAYQSLQWSSNGAEETGTTNTRVDLLSNGFKLRQANGPNNSDSYIYAAWAAAPQFNLYGGQSNAR